VRTSRSGLLSLAVAGALLLTGCSAAFGSAPDGAGPSAPAAPGPAAGTASADPGAASSGRTTGLPGPAHVVIAIFENKDAEDLERAPYLSELARQGAGFTDAHGVTHPSQPNYLALFSGSTQGVTDDDCPQSVHGDNLAAQLGAAGHSFTGYSEGLPRAGYTGCDSGRYARRHNPWADFPALPASVNQPLSAMPADYARLPTVAMVVPDVCNDMHDCSVATGDDWARQHLAPYAAWAATHDSLLVVTFDEDEGGSANHIPTMVVGAGVRPGTSSDQRIDHYSVLRTIEDMYGLPPLGRAAAAAPITGIWG
jgi:phosphatidylinositol-3-phosphatase